MMMKSFSFDLISNLLDERTFNEAYQKAFSNQTKEYDERKIKSIKWIEGSENGNDKLFDNQSEDKRKFIYEGTIDDQSIPYGPTNINTYD